MFKSLLAVMLVISQPVSVKVDSFSDAKILADRDEARLSPDQAENLVLSQRQLLKGALTSCPNIAKSDSARAVVMMINASGTVVKTWLSGGSASERCLGQLAKRAVLFKPPFSPFYTSLEIGAEPTRSP
jgi:hypothetical protein